MNRPAAMQDMSWLLTNFADSVAGIAHVVAVSADGLLLASSRDLPADRADQLAAITSGVVSLTEGAARMFSAGGVLQTVIEMDSGYLFLMSISDGSSMAVLAARSCDVGQVGYEMALLVERVGAALVPLPWTRCGPSGRDARTCVARNERIRCPTRGPAGRGGDRRWTNGAWTHVVRWYGRTRSPAAGPRPGWTSPWRRS